MRVNEKINPKGSLKNPLKIHAKILKSLKKKLKIATKKNSWYSPEGSWRKCSWWSFHKTQVYSRECPSKKFIKKRGIFLEKGAKYWKKFWKKSEKMKNSEKITFKGSIKKSLTNHSNNLERPSKILFRKPTRVALKALEKIR